MKNPTTCFFIVAVLGAASTVEPAPRVETGFLNRWVMVEGDSFRYQVFVPAAYSRSQRWPVILFLHGSGERGTDGLLQTEVGLGSALRRHPERYPALVVFPQAPATGRWPGSAARIAMAALDQTLEEFCIDPSRLYLTGMSMGGNGAWYIAYHHPDRFAAIVPICGWVAPNQRLPTAEPVVPADSGASYRALARRLRGVPVWAFHGEVDPIVPVDDSRQATAALREAGAWVRYTELSGVGHGSWDAAYGTPELPAWLFAQRRTQLSIGREPCR